jgi:hypothetical protein
MTTVFHASVFLDGDVPGLDGTPELRALPRLSTTDVADALKVKVMRPFPGLTGPWGREEMATPISAHPRLSRLRATISRDCRHLLGCAPRCKKRNLTSFYVPPPGPPDCHLARRNLAARML